MPAIQRARQSDTPLRQPAPRALPRVATDGGRRSASATPTIGLEHAGIIRELLAVGVVKETEMFFFPEHLLLPTRWNYWEPSGGYQNTAMLTVEILKQKKIGQLKQRR
jgi:hypothetical protein